MCFFGGVGRYVEVGVVDGFDFFRRFYSSSRVEGLDRVSGVVLFMGKRISRKRLGRR